MIDHGRIVELGEVERLFREPASPITRKLLAIARGELEALGGRAIDPNTG